MCLQSDWGNGRRRNRKTWRCLKMSSTLCTVRSGCTSSTSPDGNTCRHTLSHTGFLPYEDNFQITEPFLLLLLLLPLLLLPDSPQSVKERSDVFYLQPEQNVHTHRSVLPREESVVTNDCRLFPCCLFFLLKVPWILLGLLVLGAIWFISTASSSLLSAHSRFALYHGCSVYLPRRSDVGMWLIDQEVRLLPLKQ